MASKVLIAFLAIVAVAVAYEFAEDFSNEQLMADMEFIKRDPVMQDFFLAEKRGRQMKKYKVCTKQANSDQTCWCSRRKNTFLFCTGAGEGIID